MSPYIGLVFDVITLAALGATIAYARHLSKQFDRMQADRQAFEQLISALNLASSRAEAAIRALKETATATGDSLQTQISNARSLTGELEIMIQAGDTLADRLGVVAEKGRKAVAPDPEPARSLQAPRSRAEQELMEAMKNRDTKPR